MKKKIKDVKHNEFFKLIFFYYDLINNNINYKESFFARKIIIMYLEKELSLFEFEMIKIFKLLFSSKKNKQNYNLYKNIKFKNNVENKNFLLINLLKDKNNIIFNSETMTNKFSNIFSIINNIIDIFLLIFNEMKKDINFKETNIIELFLEKNINNIKNYSYSYNYENEEKYYNRENMSKLFKIFCIYFWLFYSLFTFIEEMNNNSLLSQDLSKENVLISLLHIYYYYKIKYPDEPPILKREIIQYIKFYISYYNKNNINKNIISFKMKNIIEIYMEKELINENFKEIFSENKNENSINSSKNSILQNKENDKNEIINIYNYLKINDIQFDMYLKQFKSLFLNNDNNLLNCNNDFIINLKNNMKKNKYLNKAKILFIKYNKLLKYTKFIELLNLNISIYNNIILNDIHLSNENFINYDPQILFSMRKSIEQLYSNRKYNGITNDEINKYIEIIPRMNININSNSENNTTIINNNTIYSFSNNNNINNTEIKNENNEIIKNDDINIIIKDNNNDKFNDTMVKNNKNENNIYGDKLIKSVNLDELMKRIKNKNQFYCCDYNEEELKCKYLSIKLLYKFLQNKKIGIRFLIFKKIKALYHINKNNKIENQINIIINENNDEE